MDWLIMQILIDFCDPQGINTSALRCAFDAPLQTLVAHTPEQVKPLLHQVQAHARQGRWLCGISALRGSQCL
jgi:para-aminobenzoate synthetase/4-amino-4-deoxychorismate lyase